MCGAWSGWWFLVRLVGGIIGIVALGFLVEHLVMTREARRPIESASEINNRPGEGDEARRHI